MLLKNELIYSWKRATGNNNWVLFNNILILMTSKKRSLYKVMYQDKTTHSWKPKTEADTSVLTNITKLPLLGLL